MKIKFKDSNNNNKKKTKILRKICQDKWSKCIKTNNNLIAIINNLKIYHRINLYLKMIKI